MGFPELLAILVIILVIFGGGKLPAIGDALGRGIRDLKAGDREWTLVLALALLAAWSAARAAQWRHTR